MKTPDKIYLERILCSDEVYDTWKSQKTISDDIEYIRTDAFIEKACSILKDISCPFEIIEQFKNRIR